MPISTVSQKGLDAPLSLTAPNLGTPSAINLSNATALPKAALPTGSVLQVVSAAKTDTFSTNSTTMVDVTGLSVSITPSSSSNKILIMYQFNGGVDSGTQGLFIQLVRNSTAIFIGDAAGSRPRQTAQAVPSGIYGICDAAGSFLDSPATTSATTYKIQMMVNGGGANLGYVNRSFADRDNALYDGRTASSITVMEIAG
jgi:hypothetical protein